ncbi:hypothetical protein [Nocardia phage NBR1]|uniref:hypothetical protein n=1 Tax=Nocardia phage NBR1 TaxID=1109711 RepID=UPI00023EEDEA|nr:hypothetical protein NoPhNBR1_gp39 [Nocardia phage NBR1]AEV52252.1 hypothetical protein [Nocardia phage NBR1]
MSVYTLCMASHRYTPVPNHHYPVSRAAQVVLALTVLFVVAVAIEYWYVSLPALMVGTYLIHRQRERARAEAWEARLAAMADAQHQAYIQGHPYGTHGGYVTPDQWAAQHSRRA